MTSTDAPHPEHRFVVPCEARHPDDDGVVRGGDPLAVKGVVEAAVLVLLAYAAADLEIEAGRDGDVAGVEQAVDVAAQEDAVGRLVDSSLGVGADVSGVERRQSSLTVMAQRRR